MSISSKRQNILFCFDNAADVMLHCMRGSVYHSATPGLLREITTGEISKKTLKNDIRKFRNYTHVDA